MVSKLVCHVAPESFDVHAKAVMEGKAVSLGQSSMSKDEARSYLAEARKYEDKMSSAKAASRNKSSEQKEA